MKCRLLIVNIAILFFAIPGLSKNPLSLNISNESTSKGIVFFDGTWEDAKLRAKQENKPIFIDFYTTWCGPCKKMDKEIFILEEVGKFYNSNFINFKINAEKGVGIELVKKYKITGYPTFFFVSAEETPFFTMTGYMPSDKFLSSGILAKKESTDPKPLALWQSEYDNQKSNKVFVEEYLLKLVKLKLNAADILDQYITLVSKNEFFDSPILEQINFFTDMNSDGPFFTLLNNNKKEITDVFLNKYKRSVRFEEFLLNVLKNDVNRAIEKNDETLLNHLIKTISSSNPGEVPLEWHIGEIKTKYYLETENTEKLNEAVIEYAINLLNFDIEIIKKQDSEGVIKFKNDVESGKLKTYSDSVKYNQQIKFLTTKNQVSYAYRIRTLVTNVAKGVKDKAILERAEQWINTALLYSDNFTLFETKSILLYAQGKEKEAIECSQKAIDIYSEMVNENKSLFSDKIMLRLESLLSNIKAGKKI